VRSSAAPGSGVSPIPPPFLETPEGSRHGAGVSRDAARELFTEHG